MLLNLEVCDTETMLVNIGKPRFITHNFYLSSGPVRRKKFFFSLTENSFFTDFFPTTVGDNLITICSMVPNEYNEGPLVILLELKAEYYGMKVNLTY